MGASNLAQAVRKSTERQSKEQGKPRSLGQSSPSTFTSERKKAQGGVFSTPTESTTPVGRNLMQSNTVEKSARCNGFNHRKLRLIPGCAGTELVTECRLGSSLVVQKLSN